jgi:hypothetical protein
MDENKDIIDEFREMFGAIKASVPTKKTTKTVEGEALPILTHRILVDDIFRGLSYYLPCWTKTQRQDSYLRLKFKFSFSGKQQMLEVAPTRYTYENQVIDFSTVSSLEVFEDGFLKSKIVINTDSGQKFVCNLGFMDFKRFKPIYDNLVKTHKNYLLNVSMQNRQRQEKELSEKSYASKKKEKQQENKTTLNGFSNNYSSDYQTQFIRFVESAGLKATRDYKTDNILVYLEGEKIALKFPHIRTKEDYELSIDKLKEYLQLRKAKSEVIVMQSELENLKSFGYPNAQMDYDSTKKVQNIMTRLDQIVELVENRKYEHNEVMLNALWQDEFDEYVG